MDFTLPEILPLKKHLFLLGGNSLETNLRIMIKEKLIDETYEWLISDANIVCLANDIYPLLDEKIYNKDNFKIRMYDLLYKRGKKVNILLTCVTPGMVQDLDKMDIQNIPFIEHTYTNPLNIIDYVPFITNKNNGTMWNLQPSTLPYQYLKERSVSIGSWLFINKGFYPVLRNAFGTEEKVINRWLLSLYNFDNSEKMGETDSTFFYRLGSAFVPNLKLRDNENANLLDNNLLLHEGGGWIICHTPKIEKKSLENSSFILDKSVIHVNYDPFRPLENKKEFNLFSVINNDAYTFIK